MIAIQSAYFGHIFCNQNPNFYYIDSYGNRFGYPFFLLFSFNFIYMSGGKGRRERERETERDRQRQTERDRQRERERVGGVAYDSKTVKYYD